MAVLKWYLFNGVVDGWQFFTDYAQVAATLPTGWVVGVGTTFSSELQSGVERASTTFVGNTVPDGTLDLTLKDAFRLGQIGTLENPMTGTFQWANWDFRFAVVSPTQGGAADGQIVFRLIAADADGSNATEITSGQQVCSIATNVSSTDIISSLNTGAMPGSFTINSKFLFIQLAWRRTGAGGMTTTNIRFRSGHATGTIITSGDFSTGLALPTIASTGKLFSTGSGGDVVIDGPDSSLIQGMAGGTLCGQSFTGHAGTLTAISLWLHCSTGPIDDSEFYLTVWEGGWTDGGLIKSSSLVWTGTFTGGPAWVQFPFTNCILQDWRTYVIQVNRTSATNSRTVTCYMTPDQYAGGTALNGSEVPISGFDLKFKLHGVGSSGGGLTVTVEESPFPPQGVTGVTLGSTALTNRPSLTVGPVAVSGATRPLTSQTFGVAVATGAVGVSGVTCASTLFVNLPTVDLGAAPPPVQAVDGLTLVSTALTTAPTLAVGPVGVSAATRATTLVVRLPTVTVGPVAVTGATRPLTSQTFSLAVATGAVGVSGVTRPSVLFLNVPTVVTGPVAVMGDSMVSAVQLFVPMVVRAAVARQQMVTIA